MQNAADNEGLAFAREGFCDRLYRDDGSLTPRTEKGALIEDPDAAAQQAVSLAAGEVISGSGKRLKFEVDTLCIHGDEPGAVDLATAVRNALHHAGFTLSPMAPTRQSQS